MTFNHMHSEKEARSDCKKTQEQKGGHARDLNADSRHSIRSKVFTARPPEEPGTPFKAQIFWGANLLIETESGKNHIYVVFSAPPSSRIHITFFLKSLHKYMQYIRTSC